MTRTQAAEIVATDVLVWCRKNAQRLSKDLIEVRISELHGYGVITTMCHWTTVRDQIHRSHPEIHQSYKRRAK